jgi:hypothetical protein
MKHITRMMLVYQNRRKSIEIDITTNNIEVIRENLKIGYGCCNVMLEFEEE